MIATIIIAVIKSTLITLGVLILMLSIAYGVSYLITKGED